MPVVGCQGPALGHRPEVGRPDRDARRGRGSQDAIGVGGFTVAASTTEQPESHRGGDGPGRGEQGRSEAESRE